MCTCGPPQGDHPWTGSLKLPKHGPRNRPESVRTLVTFRVPLPRQAPSGGRGNGHNPRLNTGMELIIARFTRPHHVVAYPVMAGRYETAVAAVKLGRTFIGARGMVPSSAGCGSVWKGRATAAERDRGPPCYSVMASAATPRPPAGASFSTSARCRSSSLTPWTSGDCGFGERGVNVLAFRLPGTGKTHALCALRYRLVEAGPLGVFAPAYRLVQDLMAAKQDWDLSRQLLKLDNFDFLLLDDMGYLPQGTEEPEVLFTLIAERHERRSLGITSNPGLLPVGAHLRQPHDHRCGHRPRGASLSHPGIRCPQLPHRGGPATGSE